MENHRLLGAQRRWWAERKDGRQRHAERRSRLSRSFSMLREAEVFPGVTNRVRQIPIPCGVLTPWAFLPVSFALPLNPSPTPDEIIVSSSVPVEDQMPGSLVATRFPSCRGSASWKTCTHMGKLAPTWENLWHVLAMAPKRPRFQKADQIAGKRCRNGCVNCKIRARRLWTHQSATGCGPRAFGSGLRIRKVVP